MSTGKNQNSIIAEWKIDNPLNGFLFLFIFFATIIFFFSWRNKSIL